MSWTTASGFRMTTKTVVAGAFIALVAIGVAVPANAQGPTGPSDPTCIQQPTNPVCAGGPYAPPPPPGPPTGPLDPACMTNPADAACAGSPYLPPPPPPPPPPVAPNAPFDTFTLGPHIDDMMPIDDTAAARPHLGGMGGPHMGGMGMGGAHMGGMGMGGAGHI